MTGRTILGCGAQLVLAGSVGWALQVHIARALRRRAPDIARDELGAPERALLAITGFVLFSCAAMVLNVALGGAVFGVAWIVPVGAVATMASPLLGRPSGAERRASGSGNRRAWVAVLVLGLVLMWLFVRPAVAGSGIRTGDPAWHLGWTEQILAGEPVPTGPAPELSRNAYPWGLHAVMASLVRVVPGTDPSIALESLHVALVGALPLAAACLARRVRRDAGLAAATAASLIAGFGWVRASPDDLVTSPSDARYGADLVVASPNSVYELFPPGLPRELAVVLLAAALVGLIWAIRARSRALGAAAGVATGLVGLVSVPMFLSAAAWSVVVLCVARPARRVSVVGWFALGALATLGLWAAPVASSFIRFGGFVNVTPVLGKEWPLVTSLGAWGLLFPVALAGIWVVARTKDLPARALLGAAGASALLLLLAVARGRYQWDLGGNATLLHQGRMWPGAHMLGAAFAGVALAALWARGIGGALCTGGLVVAGSLSLWGASDSLTGAIERGDSGFVYASDDLGRDGFVPRAAALVGPDDTVLVDSSRSPKEISFLLFQLSGVRLADYDDPGLQGNDLRIRFADLAAEWDERIQGVGFAPTYVVISEGPVLPAAERSRNDLWRSRGSVVATGSYKDNVFSLIELHPVHGVPHAGALKPTERAL
ncbi:MAG: hypothetical protein M3345_03620 [Actinomycetota bacterium]|nr:hypothetical protein [Actinomycetota bacterium]